MWTDGLLYYYNLHTGYGLRSGSDKGDDYCGQIMGFARCGFNEISRKGNYNEKYEKISQIMIDKI